jgi:hypothetical protein
MGGKILIKSFELGVVFQNGRVARGYHGGMGEKKDSPPNGISTMQRSSPYYY